jgi:myo-inositol-1(or 4)-monophosphatase
MRKDFLEIVLSAVKAGGQAAKSVIPSSGIIAKEGRGNFVTAGDLASEKAVLKIIKKHFPKDAILSEETESSLSNSELLNLNRLWVLDPIDGTNNFRNQRHFSCVSLGYVEKGIIKAGAIYDFYHDELFYGELGGGAYLNNQPISVGTQKDFTQATIATDNSYVPEETKYNLELLLKIKPVPFVLMRGSGALMMCEIAAGRTDLFFHTVLKPWDNAAGFLIVEEAGGMVKGLKGEKINFLSPTVVVGNKELVKQFVERIKS